LVSSIRRGPLLVHSSPSFLDHPGGAEEVPDDLSGDVLWYLESEGHGGTITLEEIPR
jgi:hypothetical protein